MSKVKVRNKAEFDIYKSKFNTLFEVEEIFGKLVVSECTDSIQGIYAKIKNITCIITKKGLIVDAGIQVDSPARAMKINMLSDFFVWKYDNTYELTKKVIISDLIEAQILLSGSYANISDFEVESEIDVYKYFYTDATEDESKYKDIIISPSKCKYAGSLVYSPLRIQEYNENDLIISRERVKKHGEVLTPPHIVSDMLDLLSKKYGCKTGREAGTYPIDKTALEPACGTGNFLVQVLERKLRLARTEKDIFMSVATLYGIDIQYDNVLESRLRMLEIVEENYKSITGVEVSESFLKIIADVLEKNIILGDFLYEGVLNFEEKEDGKIVPLKKPLKFKGGLVRLNNMGEIHRSKLISILETYERAYFYEWTWGSEIKKKKSYLDEKNKGN